MAVMAVMVIDFDDRVIMMKMPRSRDLTLLCAHAENSHHVGVRPDLLRFENCSAAIMTRLVGRAGWPLKFKRKITTHVPCGGTRSTAGETRLFN